jgi:hypothetical protein
VDTKAIAIRNHTRVTKPVMPRGASVSPECVASIAAIAATTAAATANVDVAVADRASVPWVEIIGHQRDELPSAFGRQPGRLLD